MFIVFVCVRKSMWIQLSSVATLLTSILWVSHGGKCKFSLLFLPRSYMTGEGCGICKRKNRIVVRSEGFTAVFWRLRSSDKLCYVVGYIRPDISNDRYAFIFSVKQHKKSSRSNHPWTALPVEKLVESSWKVMAHGDARKGKWRGNWWMEWLASTLHTTSGRGVSSITTADAHTSAASSRLNWRPRRFKWTRPFRRKTKPGFCACAITFQTQSNYLPVDTQTWICSPSSIRFQVDCSFLTFYVYMHKELILSFCTLLFICWLILWHVSYWLNRPSSGSFHIMCAAFFTLT